MTNYPTNILLKLKADSEQLYKLCNQANDWAEQNLKYEELEQTTSKVKHARRIVRKVSKSVNLKPVFALFGASQVGKSYLVKNILSVSAKPLYIEMENQRLDFLKDINPPGTGAESTGLVTRFTVEPNDHPAGFPVELKLLSLSDLICIIADSFFSDLKRLDDYPAIENFNEIATQVKENFQGSKPLVQAIDENDIWDIQEYFSRNFNKFSHYVQRINQSKYWNQLGRYAHNIPCEQLHQYVSILWNDNPELTKLFKFLAQSLKHLSFSEVVFAPVEAVMRNKGEIINVQRLRELFNRQDQIEIFTEKKEHIRTSLCALSALSAEIILRVPEEIGHGKPFMKQTDLLDFPGARGRLVLTQDSITSEEVPNMYLRGKISYLFNKYSSNFEINNLLFCTNDKQLEVNEIPSLLHDWILKNIGTSAEDRSKRVAKTGVSPLFVIFTFFNNQLKFDTTNDQEGNYDYKWDTRFNRFFQNEVVTSSYDWHTQWSSEEPNFNNFFLLRDYKYSTDTFLGFEANGVEEEINPLRSEYMKGIRSSFIQFPFVQKHFRNAAETWDSSATLNADGSEYIIKHLAPAANNTIKTSNYVEILVMLRDQLILALAKHVHSDNLAEKRASALRKGNEILFELNRVFGKNPSNFSAFINKLLLRESEIYSYFHDNLLKSRNEETFDEYMLFRSQFPQLKAENSKETNLELLRVVIGMDSIKAVETFLEDQRIDFNKIFINNVSTSATMLIDGLLDKWTKQADFSNFTYFEELGLTRNGHQSILELLKNTFVQLGLREELIKQVERKTSQLQINAEAEEFFASYSTNMINDFVTSLGFNMMSTERIEELQVVAKEYNIPHTILLEQIKSNVEEREMIDLFDSESDRSAKLLAEMAPMLENYNQYIARIKLALISNCGFVNYNVQANDELSRKIDLLRKLELSLN